ncbi:hypothetical protein B566_EDAN008665 [Ephemera danica]|nr:hypothetical protein B566_EDAN008665 [Ephemera danica]
MLVFSLLLLCEVEGEQTKTLSRKKRFLIFPDGAGLSVVYCLTWGTYLQTDIFTWGQTLGIGFELPTNSSFFLADHTSAQLHRMERRDVYSKLQILLDSKGMNGRSCVLRAVCEAAKRTEPGSFLDTILRAVFTFPLSEGKREASDSEHQEFDDAQWRGWTNQDCGQVYSECSTSLIKLAFATLDPFTKK